jgi:Ricin-type beta-trefoil lectin domain-like
MPRNLLFLSLILSCALPAAAQAPQGSFNAPGRYEIQSVASGQLLDVDTSDNQAVQQYSRTNRENQQWDIQPAGGGYFYIRSVGAGKVLSVAHGSRENGARVIVYRQHGSDDQLWQILNVAPAQFQILSKFGKALDVPDGSRDRGVRLQIWDSTQNDSQRFRLVLVNGVSNWAGWGGNASPPWTQQQPGPAGWDRRAAAHACRDEVARHIADLPLSEIAVDPVSSDAQGNFIVMWRTSRGSSGFCRVDPSNQILEFKVEETSP